MVRLNLSGKGFDYTDRLLVRFKHLRYLDISKNLLQDISDVLQLPYLLTLNASDNRLSSIDVFG